MNKNRKRILVLSAAVFAAVALIGFVAMAIASGSIETSPNVNESILNDIENRIKVANATFIGPPPPIFNNATDVEEPQEAHSVPISEDKLRELDKEEELNPKEPYVLALWGGEYKPAPNEKICPRLEKRIKETKNNTNETTYCYIMISGLILPSKIKELEERGVKVVGWYPPHCIAVKVQLNKIAEIKNLSFVKWIGYGDPMMKLHPALQKALKSENKEEKRKIYISLYEEDTSVKEVVIEKGGKQGIRYIGAGKFRDALERNGVDILAYDNSLKQYHAEASLDVIQKIAYLDFVAAIEPEPGGYAECLDESAFLPSQKDSKVTSSSAQSMPLSEENKLPGFEAAFAIMELLTLSYIKRR